MEQPPSKLCVEPYGASAGGTRVRHWVTVVALAACSLACLPVASLRAQERKPKVPLLGKLGKNPNQAAYSGTVQSLDIKQNILSVNSRHGRDTEIFPLKKDLRVETLNGKRLQVEDLTPGTRVLIYFGQKHGERMVKNIVVLESGKNSRTTKPPPAT